MNLNEIMPKKFQIRNVKGMLYETDDRSHAMTHFMNLRDNTWRVELLEDGKVIHSKGGTVSDEISETHPINS